MHPTFSYFTLTDGSIITYDVEAGIFLLGGKEYVWVKYDTESLQEFLEGFQTVEKLRDYLGKPMSKRI